MFCKRCGKKISDNATFCPYCGERVSIRQQRENKENVAKSSTARKAAVVLAKINAAMGFSSFLLVILGVILVLTLSTTTEPVPEAMAILVMVTSILSEIFIFVWVGIGIAQCPVAFQAGKVDGFSPTTVAVTMGIFSGIGLILWIITLIVAVSILAWILLFICLGVGIFNSLYAKSLTKTAN